MEKKMTRSILAVVLLMSATWVSASLSFAGNENGNGGDPLRNLFEDGRRQAAARVLNLQPCSFQSTVPSSVRDWILERKNALATDILESRHVWITDAQPTCAFTQTHSRADITLAFSSCGLRAKDVADAGRVLVHESVHHFGISNEEFPDQVAIAVYLAESTSACPLPPASDPFDPASCPGAALSTAEFYGLLPLPNATEKSLGRYTVFSRMRTCYATGFCSDWREADVHGFVDYRDPHHFGKYYVPAKQGEIKMALVNNEARLVLKSDAYATDWTRQVYYQLEAYLEGTVLQTRRVFALGDGFLKVGFGPANSFQGMTTRACARLVQQGTLENMDNQGNHVVTEYETVMLSHFN
jgi:hypothetical protein